jgi:hypothetical protein
MLSNLSCPLLWHIKTYYFQPWIRLSRQATNKKNYTQNASPKLKSRQSVSIMGNVHNHSSKVQHNMHHPGCPTQDEDEQDKKWMQRILY